MHDLVLVFLRVDDPGHGVDARKERVDPLAMLGGDGVEIRQVEDRELAQALGAMLAHLRHAEPAEKTSELLTLVGRDPCDGLGRGRATGARRAHLLAGERVEDRALSDAGPAGHGEHVGVARESETRPCRVAHARRGGRLDPEHCRGFDRLIEVRETALEIHQRSSETEARSLTASSWSAAGRGASASKRSRSAAKSDARSASSRARACSMSCSIARSPKRASSSF